MEKPDAVALCVDVPAQRADGTATSEPNHPGKAPRMTLRTYALAAAATLVSGHKTLTPETPEAQFLLGQLETVAPGGAGWASTLLDYLRQPAPTDIPLIQLAQAMGLTGVEMLAVALATAVEDDVMAGRAIAYLQAPLGGSRPTLGLLAAALADVAAAGVAPLDTLLTGAACRSGLFNLIGEGVPLPERAVAVPVTLCLALRGYDGAWPGTILGLGETLQVPLPPSIHEEAQRQTIGLLSSTQRTLVMRTGSLAEGKSVACAMAHTITRRALFIETTTTAGIAPWLILRQLMPVFVYELGPGERKMLPPLPSYHGPILVLTGPDGSVEIDGGLAPSWSLPVPPREERRQLWQVALGDEDLALELAEHHRHNSGRIAMLGQLAGHQSVLQGRRQPIRDDVIAASWHGEGTGLDALAQPLRAMIPDAALVTTPTLRHELGILLLRCHSRDRLVQDLGAAATARYHPGVRALFVGPSGTGKTLAAGWLATKLGLPLYRVDLASVTSKYIGETEKNLAQLLARAEQAEVVLLFDEADALFGKRTEVKEANDRFANAQTNYLLQRIESFDGITLLTSNSRSRFDAAFSRRLDMIIEFPLPGPEERRALWQAHLGTAHRLTPKDMNQLAVVADLGGGHIRNAVLMAAVLAQHANRPIEYADVVEGLLSEYRKLGRQLPAEVTHRTASPRQKSES